MKFLKNALAKLAKTQIDANTVISAVCKGEVMIKDTITLAAELLEKRKESEKLKEELNALEAEQDTIAKEIKQQASDIQEYRLFLKDLIKTTLVHSKRDYGNGFDREYKQWVHEKLAIWRKPGQTDEQAFKDLYCSVKEELKLDFNFFDEFRLFKATMERSGKPRPNPKYDWNKLDMLSCNKFWQALGKYVLLAAHK